MMFREPDAPLHPAPEIDLGGIDQIVADRGTLPRHLISILRAIQERYHYLPQAALQRVCQITDISPANLVGVSRFYSLFRHRPAGRHTIKVCLGTACHVKGGMTLLETFHQVLHIPAHEDTDPRGLFTVERVACLGCCMLAPVVQIDDFTFGHLEPKNIANLLQDFVDAQDRPMPTRPKTSAATLITQGEVRVCLCSSCTAGGSQAVFFEAQRMASHQSLPVAVKAVGCTGISFETPLVDVVDEAGMLHRYGRVDPERVAGILHRHFQPKGLRHRFDAWMQQAMKRVLTDDAWNHGEPDDTGSSLEDTRAFANPDTQLATQHSGKLDPLDLDEYRRHGGFEAAAQCLNRVPPEKVIAEVQASGLRGRGGAGFPTGRKWELVRRAGDPTTFIICNGDEGDPGAFMDRMLLESFPFRVIEGMLIAAYAIGAHQGFLYIRSEYPLAVKRIQTALAECRAQGLLGSRILDTDFSLDLELVEGAGAFVCGEETALIAAIEGRRGQPRVRPPYPAEHGLWGKPTLINNVESYALVPWIMNHGGVAFARLGTASSAGTKTFALAGKIHRGGLIEVPMGVTLRQIVCDVAGGIPDGRALKAVLVGGPSGGCIPESLCDTPVDFDALTAQGAMMGSGGLVVLDDTDCMVDIARYFMSFIQQESCGQCVPCRLGTKAMLEILDRLCEGKASSSDIVKLEELAELTQNTSLCGLGKTAANPVLTTLRYFREEYEAHAAGRCPAGKCKALITYHINDRCNGCTRCAQHCPAQAIDFHPYHMHQIDIERCTRCDICRQVCPTDAVEVRS